MIIIIYLKKNYFARNVRNTRILYSSTNALFAVCRIQTVVELVRWLHGGVIFPKCNLPICV